MESTQEHDKNGSNSKSLAFYHYSNEDTLDRDDDDSMANYQDDRDSDSIQDYRDNFLANHHKDTTPKSY